MIALGSKVRDKFTGFAGIATGRTEWLYGCTRICIEPTELRDGKLIEGQWFDEQRVEVVEEVRKAYPPSGGPQADPHRGPGAP